VALVNSRHFCALKASAPTFTWVASHPRRFRPRDRSGGGRHASGAPAVSPRGLFGGHSRDSSHHRIPWRICSDFDRPVRAVIDCSLSSTSVSIMNVQRFFLITALAFSCVPAQG